MVLILWRMNGVGNVRICHYASEDVPFNVCKTSSTEHTTIIVLIIKGISMSLLLNTYVKKRLECRICIYKSP